MLRHAWGRGMPCCRSVVGRDALDEVIGRDVLDEVVGRDALDEVVGRDALDEDVCRDVLDEVVGRDALDEVAGRDVLDGVVGRDVLEMQRKRFDRNPSSRPHNAPDVQVARVGARAYGGGAKGAEKAAYLKAIAHGVNDREMAL